MDSGRIFVRKSIKLSYQVTGIIVALLWLFQASAVAGIYKWRDDQGKLHFTDSKSKIPLKYRENVQKLRGVAEPKPEPVEEPASGPEKEKEAVASEPAAGGGNGAEKEPEKEEQDPKLVAMLKATIKFFEDKNREHTRLIKFVKPDKQNGRYYIVAIRKGVGKKTQMVDKLKGFKLPSLKRSRRFIKSSLLQDKQEKIGGEDYLERLQRLKQRLEREIMTQKKIIKKLKSDLKTDKK